ncbi:MAG: PKD domain-containing protein [Bacteroidota bacterium]
MFCKNLRFIIFLSILILILSPAFTGINYLNAQACVINGFASPSTITCGYCLDLSAYGYSSGNVVFTNDFNDGTAGTGWQTTPAATFTNPCGPGVDGTIYMWMGDATPDPRTMTSQAFDLSLGGSVCFDLMFATQTGDDADAPCEGPDLPDEGVHLQYSTDGGATWIDIYYFDPNGGYDAYLTTWNNYCFPLPPGAMTPNTMIQWWQNSSSGYGFDHWGIDNVTIALNDPNYYIEWFDGTIGEVYPNNSLCPTTSTTYDVMLTNGIDDTCYATIPVTVVPPNLVVAATVDTTICESTCVDLTGIASVIVSPASQPEFCDHTFESIIFGGVDIDINVAGLNMTNITPGSILSVCLQLNMSFGDLNTIEVVLECPDGTELTLIPDGSTTGAAYGGILDMTCFTVGAITPISSGTDPYIGDFVPGGGALDDLVGCTANGVWTIQVNNSNFMSMGFFLGWCITFDDPEISYTANFSWSPTTNMTNETTLTPTVCPVGIGTSIYTLTATDVNNCITLNDVVSITTIACLPCSLTVSASSTDASCNGVCDGDATANPLGGPTPYTYQWDANAGNQATQAATGLCVGSYTVTVTDADNCTETATATINEPSAITLSMTSTPATCGLNDGTATVTASGGAGSYSYSWSPSGGSGAIASNLSTGTYTVTVTDANNCTQTDNITVINTGGPTANITSSVNVSCFGDTDGEATVSVTGGTVPFTYSWSDGQTTTTATGLAAGFYTVTVTDAGGCIATDTVTITQPSIIIITLGSTGITCNGGSDGSIVSGATGGVPSYTYLWDDVMAQTTATATGLTSGTYCVTVTDANGCTAMNCDSIIEPAGITLTPTSTPAACGFSDGTAAVTVTGGSTPYFYLWSDGQTTTTATGLTAGSYNITITDANGCTAVSSVVVNGIGGPTLTTTITDITCNGGNDGSATVTASLGTIPYTYLWSDGQATSTATGLTSGTYDVTVTDASGCISIASSITISEPAPVTPTITGDTTICIGGSITINASATGGTPPYSYLWDNGLGPGSSHIVTPTTTTTYTVIVYDINSCPVVAQSVTVSTSSPLSVIALGTDTICYGDNTSITAVASGGDGGPYTYIWDNGAGMDSLVQVSPAYATTYTVTVSDGCGTPDTSASVTIVVTPALVLTPAAVTICLGESAVLLVSGALTYWWAEENAPTDVIGTGSTITVSPSVTTNYIVTGSDGVCTRPDTVTVTVNSSPVADFGFIPDETTITNPVFTFTDQSSSSVASWLWDFGDDSDSSTLQNPVYTYSDTGTFAVLLTVYDSSGCEDTALYYVTIRGEYILFTPNAFIPNSQIEENRYFLPKGLGLEEVEFEMYIYDRWGDLIYETDDINKPWDGTANDGKEVAQNDVYVWVIKTRDFKNKRHQYVGHVTLIR